MDEFNSRSGSIQHFSTSANRLSCGIDQHGLVQALWHVFSCGQNIVQSGFDTLLAMQHEIAECFHGQFRGA